MPTFPRRPASITDRSGAPVPGISRRGLLTGAAAGLAGAVLLGTGQPARAERRPTLAEPTVLRSRLGVLDVTLRAAITEVVVDGRPRRMMTYNGELPGPTLVAHPGDLLRIRLVNDLDTPTNLHTHGLHVSGEGNADNIFIRVDPGETFDYEIQLRPDHHTGTNWYHPHHHGEGARQLFAGLFGVLVVAERGAVLKSTGISRERMLAISAPEFGADGQLVAPLASNQAAQVRLVNGQVDPAIDIAPGETQRWRFVNTSVNNVVRVRLDDHTMTRIAADGSPYRQAVEVDEVMLASGQRADVLVTGDRRGEFTLRTLPYDYGFGVVLPEARLATMVCGGRPAPSRRVHPQRLLKPFVDLRRHDVQVRRELAMTMAGGFGINGVPFDHGRVDQVCELGAVEEWTVRNPTGLPHPFHIHVNPFQVTHVNGEPVDSPSYEDTTIVQKNGGSITLRTRFEHFTGTAIYHCHFVTHAELGMMGVAEVVDPDDPVPVTASLDPRWSCTVSSTTV